LFVIPQGSPFAVALASASAVVCTLHPNPESVILSEDVRALANIAVEGPAVALAVACSFHSEQHSRISLLSRQEEDLTPPNANFFPLAAKDIAGEPRNVPKSCKLSQHLLSAIGPTLALKQGTAPLTDLRHL
jgi:hypothetical protein